MATHVTDTTENGLKVHPLRVEDVKRFGHWGHHTDVRFQEYDFPNLEAKNGNSDLRKRLWFHKRSVPFLKWLYGIEDPSEKLVGYFKIVKKHIFQKKAELSMILDPDAMGKRYGTDAFIPLLRICFNKLGLKVVWVRVLAFNTRPIRLLEKTGFEHYINQLEPYSDQIHIYELLYSYPNDFSLTGVKLMTRYCYLRFSSEQFHDRYEAIPKAKNQNRKSDESTSRPII